jgi:hypothetical protein
LPKEAVVIRYEAGFYSLGKEAGAYIRWMAEEGVVLLINRSGREMKTDLELEWVSFRAPKNIRLEIGPLIGKEIRENPQTGSPKINFRLDNALRQDLWVSPDGGRHTLKNLRLLPGFTALKLAVLPAGGEREVLKDAHNRLVSIGLKKIQWIEKTGEK